MRKIKLFAFLLFAVHSAFATTFYSEGNLAPQTLTNWNSDRDGTSGLTPANFTSVGDIFIIQGGSGAPHTMATSSPWILGAGVKVQVEGGAVLQANSSITFNSTATFQLDANATYIHNNTGSLSSQVFQGIESFASTSTVQFNNCSTTGPSGVTFGNIIYNAAVNMNSSGGITTINGNLTINAPSGDFRLTGATALTLTIAGNLIIQQGTLTLGNGTAAPIVNLSGNFNMSGGTLTYTGSGGTATINFVKAGTQTFTKSGGSIVALTASGRSIVFNVNNGSTLDMGTNILDNALTSTATFNLASGASIITGNTNATGALTSSGTNGSIQVSGSRTFNTGANYTFNSGAAQVTGNGLPTTVNNLTIDNSSGVTSTGSVLVSGALTLLSGALNPGSNTLTLGGTVSRTSGTITSGGNSTVAVTGPSALVSGMFTSNAVQNLTINRGGGVTMGGNLIIDGTLTLTGGAFTVGANTLTLSGPVIGGTATNLTTSSVSSLVMVGSSSGTFVPSSVTDLSNLIIGNTASVSLNGNITIANLLTVNASGILDAGTNQITGTGTGTWNINGTLITADPDGFAGASKTIPSATIALGAASTIEYNATSGTQYVDGRSDYANLILSGASLKTIGNGIEISGNFSVSGGTATPPASMTFDGTVAQSIAGLSYETVAFNGTGNKTFNSDGSVATAVTFAAGQAATIDFDGAANDKVFTVKSTAVYTARIEDKESYTLSGNIKAERYFPSKRAWRLMAAPVSSTGTIYTNWQNAGVNAAGIGTLITGPGADPVTNGLDASPQNTTTLYTYNQGGNAWAAVTNTKTLNVADNAAYLIFIRGDRNTNNLNTGTSNTTTLHSIGAIKNGDQNFTTNATADGYTLFGNPFPSPVNFDAAYVDADNAGAPGTGNNTNLQRRFYTWDPTLGDRGAYVTISDDNNDGTYDNSNVGSTQTSHIQSGQGFFAQTRSSGIGTSQFTIKESHKSATNNNNVFRPGLQREKLAIVLKRVNADGSLLATDGCIILFENTLSKAIDAADADKFTNMDENVSFRQGNKLLSIQGLPLADVNDTIFLNIAGMKQRNYQFIFEPSNFNAPGLTPYLEDAFTGISSPLDLSAQTVIPFSVTSNTATSAAERFRIVFRSNNPLPVSFINVKAFEKNNAIQLEWNIASESGVNRYEVEESTDAINFGKSTTVAPKANNNTTANYSWLDKNIANGKNYYRIKSFRNNGEIKLSPIVRVNIGQGHPGISLYPNPVKGSAINVQLNNMEAGDYSVQMYNAGGQVIMSRSFTHHGGSATQAFTLDKGIVNGIYQLVIKNNRSERVVQTMIVNN